MLPTVKNTVKKTEATDIQKIIEMEYAKKEGGSLKGKHLLISIIVLVVVISMTVTITLCAHFIYSPLKDVKEYHSRYHDKNGVHIDETVNTDVTNDIVVYHVNQDGKQSWLLQDFKRDIQVYKMPENNSTNGACYVSSLDKSERNPASVRSAYETDKAESEEVEDDEDTEYMEVSNTIRDPSFLGQKVVELCKGLHVYWSRPTSDTARTSTKVRRFAAKVKRCKLKETCVRTSQKALVRKQVGKLRRAKRNGNGKKDEKTACTMTCK